MGEDSGARGGDPFGPELLLLPFLWGGSAKRLPDVLASTESSQGELTFSGYLPPREGGLQTKRDATGRPWRQPRMGVRRRPRAARPERASGCRNCRALAAS